MKKWICNKCCATTTEYQGKNKTCSSCNKGRMTCWITCNCGEIFKPRRLEQKYCSKKCLYKYRDNTSKKGKEYPHLRRAKIRKCFLCAKEFRAIKDTKNYEQKYCSKECWSKRNPPKIKKCLHCDSEFEAYEWGNVYCNQECRDKDYEKRFKGENAANWKGGKTKEQDLIRNSKKYKEWRKKVFQRDKYECRICKRKKNIHAHHIKEFAEYPQLIFDVNNGVTWCAICHSLHHGHPIGLKTNEEKRIYKEKSNNYQLTLF